MYSVTAYKNTGFNAINIPASPSVLNAMTSSTFPALDILQDDGLSSVSVRGEWDDVKDIDYIRIGDIFYCVPSSPYMTSSDVAVIPLLPDYLTTAGGASSLTYTDGMTDRFSVENDSWGEYPESDPYMAPAEPLQMDYGNYVGDDNGGSCYLFIESTINLYKLGSQFKDDNTFSGKGITFTDTVSKETVTVPYTEGVTGTTQFSFGPYAWKSIGTVLFDTENETVQKGMAACRALGVTSGIISQTALPKALVTATIDSKTGYVSYVTGKTLTGSSGLDPNIFSTSYNKINYSDFNKYGILTSGGSKIECSPVQVSGGSAPDVTYISDPRPGGKTYFKYSNLPGQTYHSFFINSVDGSEWASVPLVWTEPNGSYQNKVNFDISGKSELTASNYQRKQYVFGQATNAISGAAGMIGSAISGDVSGFLTTGVNTALTAVQSAMAEGYRQNVYDLQRQKELAAFQISQNIVAPDIQCPFNSSLLRDYFGNGAFCYRLRYSSTDASRISNILGRFGYKATYKLTSGMFTPKSRGFSYVQAHGVQVGDNIPKRWKDGIAEQLSGGVRVWSKHPTST